ncbi:hypothetical protein JYU34_001315 [Plutella xylostella]|uniref:Uncharacterized protein n=1 Tax=Plutella xylostella TaxID=51655 RepID=A0ABQ7R6I7_PLUXY|nr:hypothetical protein JYU34_001315 [Plutella xylostella]
MTDYIQQGHMELIQPDNKKEACYIPHQAVINEQHLTTKLRVVFDSSSPTSNGKSLNDNLHIGPALQSDLRDVTLKWRSHRVAIVGDIRQMYRRISVDERDRDYLRILWRFNTDEEIKHYRLTTVSYGTSCAPYLAIKTIKQLAEDERGNFDEKVIDSVLYEFYVDDLLTGASSTEKAKEIKEDITSLMSKGGFELHKWASNSSEIEGAEQSNRKILGINWNGHTDNFELKVEIPQTASSKPVTKRTVLSDIAKIFDPCGWLAPIVVTAKATLQKLWIDKLDWDDHLPEAMLKEWLTYRHQLSNMPMIELNRWIGITDDVIKVELHGFSDASTIAYSAVVYCRVITPQGITVTIMEAKTRVAPVKQISLPRLELCGAALLANILHRVQQALSIPITDTYAWTDATIVLAWLQKSPSYWTTFIANRITEITNLVEKERWHHVISQENPADVASRGTSPDDLPAHQLWWHGPSWLQAPDPVPIEKAYSEETDLEKKVSVSEKLVNTSEVVESELLNRFSSLNRLIRVTAYILRFLNKTRSLSTYPAYLQASEHKQALHTLIKVSQRDNFAKEIKVLEGNVHKDQSQTLKKLINGKKIVKLNPFLDDEHVMRVGGRICKADVDFNQKHPIILTKDCNLSYLIVKDVHSKTLHGGLQLMLNVIRSKYHIIGVKYLVKQVIRECTSCCRHSGRANIQLMGNLPKDRVTPQRPFSISGVDLAGPITVKLFNGRGSNRTKKGYIVLFICTAVKAVHLELITTLSTEGFLSAFRRFTSRRGHCKKLVSDCGTNFVGASKELKEMYDACLKNLPNEIIDSLAINGTEWQFNPAGAPHMGGLWEANIKSVKKHLYRVLNDTKLTFEEYDTLLCQIESVLNSRPLTPVTDDTSTYVLTPGHFLIGENPSIIPETDLTEVKVPYLKRWLYLQQKLQLFWKKWSLEYLVSLQNRQKWTGVYKNIKIGDVVLVKDERLPPAHWMMGLVVDTHTGSDSLIRVVSLRCKNTVIKRPIHKLCLLPANIDE